MKKILLLLLAVLFLIQCQPEARYTGFNTDYDTYIKTAIEKFEAKHGLAIAVVKDNQLIYEGYFGPADAENNIPVTAETDFYIASSTKSFTALATLILAEQGKIDLNKSLVAYFPEIIFATELKADSVTIRHLLTHTSGLQNRPLTFTTAFTGNHDAQKRERILAENTTSDKRYPLERFHYSNFGYVVTSMILERELEKSWQDILAETVFQPLSLKQTSAYMSDAQKFNWPVAKPYSQKNRENSLQRITLEKQDNTMHAAGGVIASARDLARWLHVHLNDGKIDGQQVFPKQLVRQAQRKQADQDNEYFDMHRFGYSYGWNMATLPSSDTLIHHYGGYAGAHAQVSFMPQYKIGVTVLVNENGQGQDMAYLLASYAFDYLSQKTGIDSIYAVRLDSAKTKNDRWLQKVFAHEAERAQRTWQLDLPFADYTGTFENEIMGSLLVRNPLDSVLTAEVGNLKSPAAEPFTRPNSIRVEMIPGQGSVLLFELQDGKVQAANLNGIVFTKK